jgi:hypothetical protein
MPDQSPVLFFLYGIGTFISWSSMFVKVTYLADNGFGDKFPFLLPFFTSAGLFLGQAWLSTKGKMFGPAWRLIFGFGGQALALVGLPLGSWFLGENNLGNSTTSVLVALFLGTCLGCGHSIFMATAIGMASLCPGQALSYFNIAMNLTGLLYIPLLPLITVVGGALAPGDHGFLDLVIIFLVSGGIQLAGVVFALNFTLKRPPFSNNNNNNSTGGSATSPKKIRGLQWTAWGRGGNVFPQVFYNLFRV